MERRLSAILAADIAGYSRLMGEDEEGTLAAVNKPSLGIEVPSGLKSPQLRPAIGVAAGQGPERASGLKRCLVRSRKQ